MYKVFEIPKKTGGVRHIEAPDPFTKKRQRDYLEYLCKAYPVSPYTHGFTPDKSIVTNAKPHINKKWVYSVDIKDFFPSITAEMVKSLGFKLKWGLCFYDFKDGKGKRLPQGAPTSPYIANLYLRKFDYKTAKKLKEFGIEYTRYADDVTFSGNDFNGMEKALSFVIRLLNRYGLEINYRKVKKMPFWKRQYVCGLTVNKKVSLTKEAKSKVRAEKHRGAVNYLQNFAGMVEKQALA
ncbi:MAG: reverse transcriptase family protein [bacterium]